MQINKDHFEIYLDKFPDVPSLVLVRSVEAKNIPISFLKEPILDLCCGDGFFASVLGLKNISGCDISEEAISIAKRTGCYDDLKICDVRKLPYEDNSFNSILANCALEHVNEVSIVLSEVARVLTNGGFLIMTVPSELLFNAFPPKKLLESIGLNRLNERLLSDYNRKQTHRNIFPLTLWQKLLNEAGLTITQYFYLFDERSYKVAILWDWLLTLPIFRFIIRFFRIVFPYRLRKVFWRRLLKQHYLKSAPLEYGGELVIVAKKK